MSAAVDELEVYLTPDGLGRAAIVRRTDGHFCIYVHWKWSRAALESLNLGADEWATWIDDRTPTAALYQDRDPEPGIYGTLDDARRELRSLRGFSQANLKT